MRFIKSTALFILILTVCVSFTSCGSDSYKNAYIYIDFANRPTTLDPQLASSSEELTVARSIFDTLLRFDENGEIIPSAAEAFTFNENVYTFLLNKNATWTNGTAVTANDFVFAFRRAVSPDTKSPYAASLFAVKNAKLINTGNADASTLGIYAEDDYTLKIELEYDEPEFKKVLTTAITSPCNEEYFNSCKGKYGRTLDTTPSNGSYYVKKWTTETKFLIRLAKNLDYNGKFEANSMRIYYTCGDDEPLSMLEHDNTDIIYVTSSEYSTFPEGTYANVQNEDTCYALFLSNMVDLEVRNALLTSVSGKTVSDSLSTLRDAAPSLFPACVDADGKINVTDYITYNPENAQKLYYKYILGHTDFKGLTLRYPESSECEATAKAVAAHWQQALSCIVNIEAVPLNTIYDYYHSGYCDAIIIPFSASSGTISDYMSNIGYEDASPEELSKALYENYRSYPLFFDKSVVVGGKKVNNINSSFNSGILDVALLIKKQ